MELRWLAVVPALLMAAAIIAAAPEAHARPSQADCGPMGKDEV